MQIFFMKGNNIIKFITNYGNCKTLKLITFFINDDQNKFYLTFMSFLCNFCVTFMSISFGNNCSLVKIYLIIIKLSK
jgi:hypothetical protein